MKINGIEVKVGDTIRWPAGEAVVIHEHIDGEVLLGETDRWLTPSVLTLLKAEAVKSKPKMDPKVWDAIETGIESIGIRGGWQCDAIRLKDYRDQFERGEG